MPEESLEKPKISEQLAALVMKEDLVKQTDSLAYGQLVFEIRDGRIYRVHVTSSLLLREHDIRPKTQKRMLYSSRNSK